MQSHKQQLPDNPLQGLSTWVVDEAPEKTIGQQIAQNYQKLKSNTKVFQINWSTAEILCKAFCLMLSIILSRLRATI